MQGPGTQLQVSAPELSWPQEQLVLQLLPWQKTEPSDWSAQSLGPHCAPALSQVVPSSSVGPGSVWQHTPLKHGPESHALHDAFAV